MRGDREGTPAAHSGKSPFFLERGAGYGGLAPTAATLLPHYPCGPLTLPTPWKIALL